MTNPNKGEYHAQSDGSYRLYTGEVRGWILCDDYSELQEELKILETQHKGGEHGV